MLKQELAEGNYTDTLFSPSFESDAIRRGSGRDDTTIKNNFSSVNEHGAFQNHHGGHFFIKRKSAQTPIISQEDA